MLSSRGDPAGAHAPEEPSGEAGACARPPGRPYARLQGLLSELTPGKAKKDITAMQAKGNSRNGAPEGPGRQDPAAG